MQKCLADRLLYIAWLFTFGFRIESAKSVNTLDACCLCLGGLAFAKKIIVIRLAASVYSCLGLGLYADTIMGTSTLFGS